MSPKDGAIPDIAELPTEKAPGQDGILEEDNAIPTWFNASFLATIVFAVVYVIFYTVTGWSSDGQYQTEVADAKTTASAAQAALPTVNPYKGNATAIAEGKEVYLSTCAACHKPDGAGLVGPSLVDGYWKFGGTDADLFQTVSGGRPGGMPAWGPQLGTEKIWKVLAYVETLPKSDAPGLGAPGGAPVPGGAGL